jgi:hypothetical protein
VPSQSQAIPSNLQGLDDQTFLGKAYIALMGRPVDPTGFRDYMMRLASGSSQAEVWGELAGSEEATRFARQGARPTGITVRAGAAPVRSVADLLALDGGEFLRGAYLALLGREPDPTGMRDYGNRLAAGESRLQVIADIHSDPEGQAFGADLEGLADVVAHVQSSGSRKWRQLDDMLHLGEAAFVRTAMRSLGNGQVDERSVPMYLAFLAQGLSRMFVLNSIARNAGPDAVKTVPGLQAALRQWQEANRTTWKGWYLRNVKGIESDLPAERRSRSILHRLRAGGETSE